MLEFLRKKTNDDAPLTVGLARTHERIMGRLRGLMGAAVADDAFWSMLEASLLEADVGLEVTSKLLTAARVHASPDRVRMTLAERMIEILTSAAAPAPVGGRPRVVLVLGVNGVGKTTTIAKLARRAQQAGNRALLVAADTFRAAAVEQLEAWGAKLGCEVVAQGSGADAAAVAFDGVAKGVAKNYDIVFIDTAGRLHTKGGLMEELGKVVRVTGKALAGAPHEKLIVLDATVGGNGLAQAREFHGAVGLTGAVVAKLDGTARGGVVLAVAGELGIPVTHVGVGEGMEDLRPFDASAFVQAILA